MVTIFTSRIIRKGGLLYLPSRWTLMSKCFSYCSLAHLPPASLAGPALPPASLAGPPLPPASLPFQSSLLPAQQSHQSPPAAATIGERCSRAGTVGGRTGPWTWPASCSTAQSFGPLCSVWFTWWETIYMEIRTLLDKGFIRVKGCSQLVCFSTFQVCKRPLL